MNDEQFNALISSLQNGFSNLGAQQAEVAATLSGAVDTYIQGAESPQEKKKREKTFRTTKERVITEQDPKEKKEFLQAAKENAAMLLKPLGLVTGAVGAIKGGLGMITSLFNGIFSVLPFGGILKAGVMIGGAILGWKALKGLLDKPEIKEFFANFGKHVENFINSTIGFLYTLFTGKELKERFDIKKWWEKWKESKGWGDMNFGQILVDMIVSGIAKVVSFMTDGELAYDDVKANIKNLLSNITTIVINLVDTIKSFIDETIKKVVEFKFKVMSKIPLTAESKIAGFDSTDMTLEKLNKFMAAVDQIETDAGYEGLDIGAASGNTRAAALAEALKKSPGGLGGTLRAADLENIKKAIQDDLYYEISARRGEGVIETPDKWKDGMPGVGTKAGSEREMVLLLRDIKSVLKKDKEVNRVTATGETSYLGGGLGMGMQ